MRCIQDKNKSENMVTFLFDFDTNTYKKHTNKDLYTILMQLI